MRLLKRAYYALAITIVTVVTTGELFWHGSNGNNPKKEANR